MRVITIKLNAWDTESLYKDATTYDRRTLLGYMRNAGKLNDPIYGAAYSLLRSLEINRGRIYQLEFLCTQKQMKEIVKIVEATRDGSLKHHHLSIWHKNYIMKHL